MIEIPFNLVGAFGQLNKACREANLKYIIKKYPDEDSYTGFVGDFSPGIQSHYCDDLFEKMIEEAKIISSPKLEYSIEEKKLIPID